LFQVTVGDQLLTKLFDSLETLTVENKEFKHRKFFDDLLYPLKKEIDAPKNVEIIKLRDLKKYKGKMVYIGIPPYINQNSQQIAVFTFKDDFDVKLSSIKKWKQYLIVQENYHAVLGNMLFRFIKYEHTIKRLCEVYNTDEMRESHSNLWELYKKYRY
jgi:hypothetical protein